MILQHKDLKAFPDRVVEVINPDRPHVMPKRDTIARFGQQNWVFRSDMISQSVGELKQRLYGVVEGKEKSLALRDFFEDLELTSHALPLRARMEGYEDQLKYEFAPPLPRKVTLMVDGKKKTVKVPVVQDAAKVAAQREIIAEIQRLRHYVGNELVTVPSSGPLSYDNLVSARDVGFTVDSDVNLAPGVNLIVGPTEAGKTTFIRAENRFNVIIRVSEPHESIDLQMNVLHASSFQEALVWALILGATGFRVVIDGGRQLVYELSGGAAMAKGISSLLFTTLTTVNNVVAKYSGYLALTINPLTDMDIDAYDLAKKMASSVSSVVFLTKHVKGRQGWWSARVVRAENDRGPDRLSTPDLDGGTWASIGNDPMFVSSARNMSDAMTPKARDVMVNVPSEAVPYDVSVDFVQRGRLGTITGHEPDSSDDDDLDYDIPRSFNINIS